MVEIKVIDADREASFVFNPEKLTGIHVQPVYSAMPNSSAREIIDFKVALLFPECTVTLIPGDIPSAKSLIERLKQIMMSPQSGDAWETLTVRYIIVSDTARAVDAWAPPT